MSATELRYLMRRNALRWRREKGALNKAHVLRRAIDYRELALREECDSDAIRHANLSHVRAVADRYKD